jgi:hypothetical protein
MKTCFAEVLARESADLAQVADAPMLAGWRCRVVKELMTPQSPYALALRQTADVGDRADFLNRWRELIAETVDRLQQPSTAADTMRPEAQAQSGGDGHKTAVLILAALYGGSILSQLAQDPRPLNAALDLALVPLAASEGDSDAKRGTRRPISNMDS